MLTPLVIEETIEINCSPEDVFQLWADIENWNKWDPDTAASHIEGDLRVGAKGRLRPTTGREVPIEVTEVVPNKTLTLVSKIPMFAMLFEHELSVTTNGVMATHRVTLSGFLLILLRNPLSKQIREGLPKTMLSLKAAAEKSAVH